MKLTDRLIARITSRPPDFIIGGHDDPYLRRWFVIPRNRFFNIYLHQFLRSDDDRALHDHPWANLYILLRGIYAEHTIAAGGIEHVHFARKGDWRFRRCGRMAHRIELIQGTSGPIPCWTLFITGPVYREWGFHCPKRGWVHWKTFTAQDDRGARGG